MIGNRCDRDVKRVNREEIEKKIDKMQSLEERQILKELLQQVLEEVIQYQEKEYAKIKQSLCEEIPIQRNRYYIASAILDKRQYYGGEWLYPVSGAGRRGKTN